MSTTVRARALPAVLAVLLLSACTSGIGTFFAPTAAVVGTTTITEADVVGQLRFYIAGQQNPSQITDSLTQGPGSETVRRDDVRGELSNLVQLAVVAEQAHQVGVSISLADIQKATANARGGRSAADFHALLKRDHITLAELQEYDRYHLILQAVQSAVTSNINATQVQIAAAYQAAKATYDAEYHAAHILICAHQNSDGTCNVSQADVTTAASVLQQLQAGADFATLAAKYSVDPGSRNQGGDLGWADPGSLLPAFETAATALQPGQISPQPVQTQDGLHIIKLIAKGRTLADATTDLNNQLEQSARSSAFNDWLTKAFAATRISINPAYGQFDRTSYQVVAPPGAEPSPQPAAPAGP